jgi:hypothetical protein
MASFGWIGFDLDGTLAYVDHDKPYNPMEIGAPIPKMVELCRMYLSEGYEVRILTARASKSQPRGGLREAAYIQSMRNIAEWCEKHIGTPLRVTSEKDYGMIMLYDDRARQVEYNTGRIYNAIIDPDAIR